MQGGLVIYMGSPRLFCGHFHLQDIRVPITEFPWEEKGDSWLPCHYQQFMEDITFCLDDENGLFQKKFK